jgi:hypothetical protein
MPQISKGKVLDAAEPFYDSDTAKLLEIRADWTTEASCGDQIGYMDWPSVLRRVRSPSSADHTGVRISSGSQLPTRPGHRSAQAERVDSETVTCPGDDAAWNRFRDSGVWPHRRHLRQRARQIPTIALGDTLNGVALDLDADSRCGLLSGRAAAETDAAERSLA